MVVIVVVVGGVAGAAGHAAAHWEGGGEGLVLVVAEAVGMEHAFQEGLGGCGIGWVEVIWWGVGEIVVGVICVGMIRGVAVDVMGGGSVGLSGGCFRTGHVA